MHRARVERQRGQSGAHTDALYGVARRDQLSAAANPRARVRVQSTGQGPSHCEQRSTLPSADVPIARRQLLNARGSSPSRTPRLELYAFCAWLVLVALPMGSNRVWALALTLPALFAIAVAATWRRTAAGSFSASPWFLRIPGLVLLTYLAVLSVQLIPIGGRTASIAPYRTSVTLLIALGCTVAFWLVIALARTDRDLKWLLYTLVGCGAVQTIIVLCTLGTEARVAIFDSSINYAYASGTFNNRNHLAAYLNLCLAAGAGLLMGQLSTARPSRRLSQRVSEWIGLAMGAKARLRLVLVLMVIALILTRSRMGNAAFFFGLMVAASVYAIHVREQRRGLMLFVASMLVIDILVVGAWVGFDQVVDRLGGTALFKQSPSSLGSIPTDAEQSLEDRIHPALESAGIVRDHPWIGTGGGTYFLAFMAYTPRDQGFFNHAHNDYLEIASDTGLIGLGALLALAFAAAWTSRCVLRERRSPYARAAAFCALMSLACLGVHSMVDFNLQIPAVAMTFAVVIALPFAARTLNRESPRSSDVAAAPEASRVFPERVTP